LINKCNLQRGVRLIKYIEITLISSLALVCGLAEAQEIFEVPSTPSEVKHAKKLKPLQKFPTLTMLAQYRGEEKKGVHYLTDQEREMSLLHICDGLLCDTQGHLLNPKFSGPNKRISQFPEQPKTGDNHAVGFAIYVMDAEGKVWITFDAKVKLFHHSSLLSGKPVAAAGEMIIFQGRLYALNNRSGHYHPPPIVIKRVLQVLQSGGISTQGIFIKEYGSDF
jgi:hypothetical protein